MVFTSTPNGHVDSGFYAHSQGSSSLVHPDRTPPRRHAKKIFIHCLATLLAALLLPSMASAQSLSSGTELNAQPGVLRTLSGIPSTPRVLTVSFTGSYSFSPDILVDGDAIHESWARLALSYAPWSFFQFGASIDQQVALYNGPDDEVGGLVSGSVGDPRVNLRTGFELGNLVSLGALLSLWFPSGMGTFGMKGSAISPSLDVSLSLTPERVPIGVHLQLGYHHNRSGELLQGVTGFTDRSLVLSGVSVSQHHLVAGLATEYRVGPAAPFIELMTDIPFDNSGLEHTWMVIGLGSRFWLGRSDVIQLLVAVEIRAFSGNPDPNPDERLVWETPPMVSAFLGLTGRIPMRDRDAVEPDDGEEPDQDDPDVRDRQSAQPPGYVEGSVLCGEEPCGRGTHVAIEGRTSSPYLVNAEDGSFRTTGLEPGSYTIVARAESFEPQSQTVEVTSGAASSVNFTFIPEETVTTGIRGRVTNFNGVPIRARIRVPDLEIEVWTDDQGQFEIEAPPGVYQVMIWSEGYMTQTTRMEVTRGGMVVMNIELRGRGRRRR